MCYPSTPTFYIYPAKWKERWVVSQYKSNYGKFRLTAGNFYGDREADKGLQTSENLKFYAISSRFQPFSNKGKSLVIQYTVKHEQKIDCGGGYVKLFPSNLNQKNMSGESLYYIMFGPDICGSDTKKVHIILNYKNKVYPVKKQIRCKVDGFTHLYTLVLKSDHTYKVKIDNKMVISGILEDDWDFLPPRRIKDPAEISNEFQSWEFENAEKPKDWDDAAQGTWKPPLLKNPLYRGEWRPRKIPNPNYKGIWPHPQIVNPEYVPDPSLSVYENISVIGLDLWQVRSGTIFDNFLITDDEKYAKKFGDETWGETKKPEQTMSEKEIKKEKKRKERKTQKMPKKKPLQKNKSERIVAQKEEL
uniref:Calreticulin 3 n=1 Tax=Naja naja TaxID=35670 RepID=A0A8C6VS21_NAJNA